MENYLNHRWPKGPGVQPPPVPSSLPAAAPVKRKHSVRRWLVRVVCIVLCLALLGGMSFWAVNGLAEWLANVELPDSDFDQSPSRPNLDLLKKPDWSPEDLPWGDPDPSVQLAVDPALDVPLSGREIHQSTLPSLVYVEAQQRSRLGYTTHAGTGIIVTQSGYVLTNYHIIDESNAVQVMLLDDRGRAIYDAEVIGFDEEFDIAVLKFDGPDLTPALLGDSDVLAVGDRVYAVGNPMGYLLGSMTDGIVSALNRDDEVEGNGLGLIQTSAALNPGNSGGALLNEAGQVVGITSAKITGLVRDNGESVDDAAVIEGIGLAIPISDILPFVNRILATGKSWRPTIGITCSEAVDDGRTGIRVASVEEGVPAYEAGLAEGDLIVSANGVPVPTLAELRRVLYRTGVDGMVACLVVRDGAEIPISFQLIDRLEEEE